MTSRAGIVVIGNEILSGRVTDLNSTWLTGQLRDLGVDVGRIVVLPDDVEVIAGEVRKFSDLFDVVFTTGGVGPTHDDMTCEGVARAFGEDLVHSEELADAIRRFYAGEFREASLRMAMIPKSSELVWREDLPFPVLKVGNVFLLPGEPGVFRKKFDSIREDFRQPPFFLRRIFLNIGEGAVADLLDEIQQQHPDVSIGSYPVYEGADYAVEITVESKIEEDVDLAFQTLVDGFPAESVIRTD